MDDSEKLERPNFRSDIRPWGIMLEGEGEGGGTGIVFRMLFGKAYDNEQCPVYKYCHIQGMSNASIVIGRLQNDFWSILYAYKEIIHEKHVNSFVIYDYIQILKGKYVLK
jgi:hypothetical protein